MKIKVILSDGREFAAKVIGQDTEADVGVLKIESQRLKSISLANSDNLRVGDFVVAGNSNLEQIDFDLPLKRKVDKPRVNRQF